MKKITIVTAANENFKKYVDYTKKSVETVGYDCLVYDLGNLGYGKPFSGLVSDKINAKIPCKPAIILDAIQQIENDDYLVWMDADTVLLESIDEVCQNYDIAVTLRSANHMISGIPINAGVIFFKKTERSIQFLNYWDKLCKLSDSDQTVLNEIIKVKNGQEQKILSFNGLLVKVFTCEEYNNFYFSEDQRAAKILHYKTSLRGNHPLNKNKS
jgi:hypothetical protein